jgi:hypothetical protein
MPIYEFYCPKNNTIYGFLARSLAYHGKIPRCPDNPEFPMERMISSFAVTGRAKEKSEADGPPVDDSAMEGLMSDMESEFSGMDEENPDPRKLARMMRKMSAVTGEPMPAGMQEMIQRMEAGEDLEKLEAEYGDAFDELEAGATEGGEGGKVKAGARRRSRPHRDPVLYEISDYITEIS